MDHYFNTERNGVRHDSKKEGWKKEDLKKEYLRDDTKNLIY